MSRLGIDWDPNRSWLHAILQPLALLWRRARQLLHGLRVAGVATGSVLLGMLMYAYVDQVHDLFLEVNGNRLHAVLFWSAFYLAVIVVWVVPVYLSARYIIARYNTLAAASADDDQIPVEPWVASLVPPLLGTMCLLAVLIGQWQAITGSPLAPRSGCRFEDMNTCVLREVEAWAGTPDIAKIQKELGQNSTGRTRRCCRRSRRRRSARRRSLRRTCRRRSARSTSGRRSASSWRRSCSPSRPL